MDKGNSAAGPSNKPRRPLPTPPVRGNWPPGARITIQHPDGRVQNILVASAAPGADRGDAQRASTRPSDGHSPEGTHTRIDNARDAHAHAQGHTHTRPATASARERSDAPAGPRTSTGAHPAHAAPASGRMTGDNPLPPLPRDPWRERNQAGPSAPKAPTPVRPNVYREAGWQHEPLHRVASPPQSILRGGSAARGQQSGAPHDPHSGVESGDEGYRSTATASTPGRDRHRRAQTPPSPLQHPATPHPHYRPRSPRQQRHPPKEQAQGQPSSGQRPSEQRQRQGSRPLPDPSDVVIGFCTECLMGQCHLITCSLLGVDRSRYPPQTHSSSQARRRRSDEEPSREGDHRRTDSEETSQGITTSSASSYQPPRVDEADDPSPQASSASSSTPSSRTSESLPRPQAQQAPVQPEASRRRPPSRPTPAPVPAPTPAPPPPVRPQPVPQVVPFPQATPQRSRTQRPVIPPGVRPDDEVSLPSPPPSPQPGRPRRGSAGSSRASYGVPPWPPQAPPYAPQWPHTQQHPYNQQYPHNQQYPNVQQYPNAQQYPYNYQYPSAQPYLRTAPYPHRDPRANAEWPLQFVYDPPELYGNVPPPPPSLPSYPPTVPPPSIPGQNPPWPPNHHQSNFPSPYSGISYTPVPGGTTALSRRPDDPELPDTLIGAVAALRMGAVLPYPIADPVQYVPPARYAPDRSLPLLTPLVSSGPGGYTAASNAMAFVPARSVQQLPPGNGSSMVLIPAHKLPLSPYRGPVLHPALIPNPDRPDVPVLKWDLRTPPSLARIITSARHVKAPDRVLKESLTAPAVHEVQLSYNFAGLLNYFGPIHIRRTSPVTVGDALQAIYEFFQVQVRQEESEAVRRASPHVWNTWAEAFHRRCREASLTSVADAESEKGLRRVDCLGEKVRYWGSWVSHNVPERTWQIQLGLAARSELAS